METVYPRLKEYCREQHGLEFQVVDMRWGVRDESTDDHKTAELCMQEIDNCQRLSLGPNFVVNLPNLDISFKTYKYFFKQTKKGISGTKIWIPTVANTSFRYRISSYNRSPRRSRCKSSQTLVQTRLE